MEKFLKSNEELASHCRDLELKHQGLIGKLQYVELELSKSTKAYQQLKETDLVQLDSLKSINESLKGENKKLKEILHEEERHTNENQKSDLCLKLKVEELEDFICSMEKGKQTLESKCFLLEESMRTVLEQGETAKRNAEDQIKHVKNLLTDQLLTLEKDKKELQVETIELLQKCKQLEGLVNQLTCERSDLLELYDNQKLLLQDTRQRKESLVRQCQDYTEQISGLIQQLETSKQHRISLEDSIRQLTEQVREYQEKAEKTQAEYEQSLQSKSSHENRLEELKGELRVQLDDLESREKVLCDRSMEIEQAKLEFHLLETTLTDLRQSHECILKELDEKNELLSARTVQLEELQEALSSKVQLVASYESENRRIVMDLRVLSSHLEQLEATNMGLKNEHEYLAREHDMHQQSNLDLSGRLLNLQTRYASLQDQLGTAQETSVKLSERLEGLLADLKLGKKTSTEWMQLAFDWQVKCKQQELMTLKYQYTLKESNLILEEEIEEGLSRDFNFPMSIKRDSVISVRRDSALSVGRDSTGHYSPSASHHSPAVSHYSPLTSPSKTFFRSSAHLGVVANISTSYPLISPAPQGSFGSLISPSPIASRKTGTTPSLHQQLQEWRQVLDVMMSEKRTLVQQVHDEEYKQLELNHLLQIEKSTKLALERKITLLEEDLQKEKMKLIHLEDKNLESAQLRGSDGGEGYLFSSPKNHSPRAKDVLETSKTCLLPSPRDPDQQRLTVSRLAINVSTTL